MAQKISTPSLLLFIILVGFPQLSETIYTPSLPDIASQLQASNNMIQLTLSIYFLGFAVGVFCWGRLSDTIGRRPAMLWGIVVYGVGSLGCYLSDSVEWLLVSRFIQAFGASTGSVVTQTILRACVFILLLGIGMTIPNCLSLALVRYSDVLGTAGAIFGLGYYVIVSLITGGMSYLHNDSLVTMPMYFLMLAAIMVIVSRRIARE